MHFTVLLAYLTTSSLLHCYGVNSYSAKTVEITEISVPENPSSGDDVTLVCRFRLAGHDHRLYKVNWWRGKDQFYSYNGEIKRDPKHAFSFNGINVAKDESTDESVVLKNVTEETSGVFKCEVIGEGPSFRTAVRNKTMTVVVPPQHVEIMSWVNPPSYRREDLVQMNCTARGAKPRAQLTWEVNGHQVRPRDVLNFADKKDGYGRITSVAGLRWRAPDYFNDHEAVVSCVASVGGVHKRASKTIYFNPASSAAFNHQHGSAGCQFSNGWTILGLASLILARSYA